MEKTTHTRGKKNASPSTSQQEEQWALSALQTSWPQRSVVPGTLAHRFCSCFHSSNIAVP